MNPLLRLIYHRACLPPEAVQNSPNNLPSIIQHTSKHLPKYSQHIPNRSNKNNALGENVRTQGKATGPREKAKKLCLSWEMSSKIPGNILSLSLSIPLNDPIYAFKGPYRVFRWAVFPTEKRPVQVRMLAQRRRASRRVQRLLRPRFFWPPEGYWAQGPFLR